eukprot:6263482-Amphidinium_carterae.1
MNAIFNLVNYHSLQLGSLQEMHMQERTGRQGKSRIETYLRCLQWTSSLGWNLTVTLEWFRGTGCLSTSCDCGT